MNKSSNPYYQYFYELACRDVNRGMTSPRQLSVGNLHRTDRNEEFTITSLHTEGYSDGFRFAMNKLNSESAPKTNAPKTNAPKTNAPKTNASNTTGCAIIVGCLVLCLVGFGLFHFL